MTPTPMRRRRLSNEQAMTELASVLDRYTEDEHAAKWTVAKRMQALRDGDALPGSPPKYPIKDQDDMDNAARLMGNGDVPRATLVAHMRKQARKHGLRLPASLQS